MAILTIAYTGEVLPGGELLYKNSQGDSVTGNSPKEILDFLARNYTDAINRKLFWNMDIAIAPLLRLLGRRVCEELATDPDCESLFRFTDTGIETFDLVEKTPELQTGLYSINYNRHTVFGLQAHNVKHKSHFYNISQYFDDEPDITDLDEILVKADELVNAFFEVGLNPMRMASAINAFESKELNRMDIPTLADLPDTLTESECDELTEWCESIMSRVWIGNHAVGYWKDGESYDYDLQSAYGYYFSELYNYRYATFWKSSGPVKEAENGLLKGTVTIDKGVKCSPIGYQDERNKFVCPVGSSWNTILTLPEVRWIYRHKIGTFELDYGYFWKQKAPVQPFKAVMNRVFDKRQKGGLVRKLAKQIGANAWGKLIQRATRDGEPYKYYSPLLALQVKTNCRLRVADFIYDNNLQDDVLHIATDGVRTSKHVAIETVTAMGRWKETDPESCLILSPGYLYTPSNKPHGLYLGDILEMIEKHPRENYYSTKIKRPVTLSEAIENDDIKSVGDIREHQTSVDLITARNNQVVNFDEFPVNGKELLENKYYGEPVKVT